MNIHHQGFLTRSIENALEHFMLLGFQKIGSLTKDQERGIFIQFIESTNNQYIELIAPFRDDSIVSGLKKKYLNQLYHTCYIVENIRYTMQDLQQKGWHILDEPKFAPALGTEVAFLFSAEIGIVELTDQKANIS